MSHHPQHSRPDHPPPSYMRPLNISARLEPEDVIYVETSMPPPPAPSASTATNLNDVAGVLRRNQACLNCRRRKLKCDAAKPHCSTCVRSYRHLLRTAPKSDPVLSCEYEDGTKNDNAGSDGSPEDYADANKKKRKISTDSGKKKEEDDTEALRKRIESLEAQLAQKEMPEVSMPHSDSSVAAPSPTAFLDMLSSAATAQVPEPPTVPGLKTNAAENVTMSKGWAATPEASGQHSGLTPYLSFMENQQLQTQTDAQRSESSEPSRLNVGQGISAPSPAAPALSPTGVFNFSPAPSAPSQNWPPPVGDNGLQPSTTSDGPWRKIETEAIYAPGPETSGDQNPLQLDEAMQQQLLMDLFWPGWPPNLPEPHIVNDMVEVFFERVPNIPRLLHRARFLARLALPPTHSNFPHPSLIHAVCAAAAPWCKPEMYSRGKESFGTDMAQKPEFKTMSFALKQAAYGKEAVQEGLDTGNRLFDVVRAMIVFSRVFIDETRMLECWAYAGLVARMLLPLGLNVRSAELSLKSVMLPPPMDALEREERRVAVWFAFYHDTVASAASGWGTSMFLDELTVPLPVSAVDFNSGLEHIEPNMQDIESPDFWTRHPVVDSFVMVLKATVLMNRINKFVRKWKNRVLREDDDLDGMNKPEFRELANAAACLQMSFPASMRNPTRLNASKKLDIDLIPALMIPQAAIINLYEPFADISDPQDGPSRRILSAAQSIVSILQQLASMIGDASQDFYATLHSSVSVCLVTAARTSLLYYRQALNLGDTASGDAHRMDIEIVRMALGRYGQCCKIGHHHAQLIEYFLDRAGNPTFDKLLVHYPEHPRPGAPDLTPNSDFGACALNALNIKRGFWKINRNSNTVSPFGSTPDSGIGQSSSGGRNSWNSGSRFASVHSAHSDSPHSASGASNAVASGSGGTSSPGTATTQSTAPSWLPSANNPNGAVKSMESPKAFQTNLDPKAEAYFNETARKRGWPHANSYIDEKSPASGAGSAPGGLDPQVEAVLSHHSTTRMFPFPSQENENQSPGKAS